MKTTYAWLIGLLLIASQLSARDYSYPALDVTIWLQSDGSMLVQEDRSFRFWGRYSEGFRTFPTDGMARFSDFEVWEGNTPYQWDESRQPGTKQLIENNQEKELQWFYQARDTTRVFSIRFRVDGAMQRFEDVAVLHYQVISPDWDKPISDISVTIIPPEPIEAHEVRQWWHGSLHITSETHTDGRVTATLPELQANRYMEVRALYPQELFPGLPPLHGLAAPDIMAEEAAWADEANRIRLEEAERERRRAQRHETGRQLAIPLSLLIIMGWVWLYRTYGRRPQPEEEPDQHTQVVPDEKPALVNYIMMGEMITNDALLATLFDLADNNILSIREQEKQGRTFPGMSKTDTIVVVDRQAWGQQKENILPYENMLLTFLFDDLANGRNEINLSSLKKDKTRVMTFFREWSKQVKKEGRARSWFDERSRKGRNIGLVTGGVLFFAGILLVVFFGPYMISIPALSLVFFIASLFIMHHTVQGKKVLRQWRKIRKLLKRVHKEPLKNNPGNEILARYVIYGIALGLGKYHLRRFLRQLDKEGYYNYLPWMIMHSSSNRSYGDVISNMVTSTASTMSSSTGAGGGGSMGGGGGASSGGGGAR